MLFILIAFVISFWLLYDTCRLHRNSIQNEKTHYHKQSVFYTVHESEIQQSQEELEKTRKLYEYNYSKYLLKLNKLESEIHERVDKYEIDSSNMDNDIVKEIKNIDIQSLSRLIMEEHND